MSGSSRDADEQPLPLYRFMENIEKPMHYRSCLLLLFGLLLCSACSRRGAAWVVREQPDGLFIGQGADSVLFYQRTATSLNGQYTRAHYIHPLYSLHNSVLTEDYPEDHLHHRGIFWAWHQNYAGEKQVGDAWALENFSWEVSVATAERFADSCRLHTEVYWKSPLWLNGQGQEKAFVQEKTDITIHKTQKNYRVIDYHIRLWALENEVQIGGSEDEKGYSGFSWRIRLPENVAFSGAQGQVIPQTLALRAGPWIRMSGNLDGQAGEEGVVVIDHPDNPGYPQPWILRSSRSMQNAAYPGRERIVIGRNEPLQLRYRMVIYDGVLSDEEVERLAGF